jgi:hypothetical protein
MRKIMSTVLIIAASCTAYSQTIRFNGSEFEAVNVKTAIVSLEGEKVLKVERDLEKLAFDTSNLIGTVDEPTFVKLKNVNLENGTIEVKMLSRLQSPNPFRQAQGFIGLAFRINEDNGAFESIYLRPRVGRSESQFARNHTVQYYAYPNYKFDTLRRPEFKGEYETYADVGLDEWISFKIEVKDKKATLYINDQKHPSFLVSEMKGTSKEGSIGLWVDIGTEGYFKDLKVTKQ